MYIRMLKISNDLPIHIVRDDEQDQLHSEMLLNEHVYQREV